MSSVTAVDTRLVRVAVELAGRGHHPALRGGLDPRSPLAQSDYWIELTGRDHTDPLDLVADPPNVVRIRAADLREAQRARADIRAEIAADGRDPDSVTVLLDVDTLIGPTAPDARRELAQLDSTLDRAKNDTVAYVGTASGLISLIADVQAAEVADGVTLRPLALPGTLELIVSDVIPWLESRGSTNHSDKLAEVLARFGAHAVKRAVAS
ncbi:hypothetical protein [Antrihabitans cavernicola]|uniref:LLM class flavin-dependent oxidoreductase n=1 Tax=Antrihabitans cavernicola TaxID=2495913 RepID=A0A5A7SI62_9NOCA|nr:hypothetical protein [Spelaeibacter cavernicola]KAA0024417.1 hypothetical protein FOY51_00135 [Spelaeibacter cavernicola]